MWGKKNFRVALVCFVSFLHFGKTPYCLSFVLHLPCFIPSHEVLQFEVAVDQVCLIHTKNSVAEGFYFSQAGKHVIYLIERYLMNKKEELYVNQLVLLDWKANLQNAGYLD